MTVEDKLKRWAERKYSLTNVESVEFDVEGGDDYGCETCGYGSTPPHIEVLIRHNGGQVFLGEEKYAHDLINSILSDG